MGAPVGYLTLPCLVDYIYAMANLSEKSYDTYERANISESSFVTYNDANMSEDPGLSLGGIRP